MGPRCPTFQRIIVGAAALVSLSACEQPTTPPADMARPSSVPSPLVGNEVASSAAESILERLSRQIPGFGGAYIRDGLLHVYLTDTASSLVAQDVVRSELQRIGRRTLPVRIERARWPHTRAGSPCLGPLLG
jgi:hypothetical protein